MWDWGIAFKPQLWGFALFEPPLAYSVFWAVLASSMLIGWSLLLRRLGFSPLVAAVTATLLFFSPFAQAWWTGIGPQLAFFPWIVLLVLSIRSAWLCTVALAVAIVAQMTGFRGRQYFDVETSAERAVPSAQADPGTQTGGIAAA